MRPINLKGQTMSESEGHEAFLQSNNIVRDAEFAIYGLDDGAIAHSPVRREKGLLPHRIVIRDLGDQFVVHTQVLEDGKKPWYNHGDYVPKKDKPAEALAKAWEHFERRSRNLLAMPEPPAKQLHAVADIAETIINSLLPDDIEDRTDLIEGDYQLESDIETFENLTGKSLWERTTPDDLGDPEVEDIERDL
jgi:hypothetical protein